VKQVPSDYYRRLHEAEERHWWTAGMRELTLRLLAGRLHGALLDAGCGTGGFLAAAQAQARGELSRLCGTDISPEAIELTRALVPTAELHVAALHALPFEAVAFDVAVLNDVLQHVHEDELAGGLGELRRVLRPAGTLLVRTNGARHGRRERPDWRLYDRASLRDELERGGFRVERVTHANAIPSLLAPAPRPPTDGSCGVPEPGGRLRSATGRALLGLEARYLQRWGMPVGHTLFALARPA
jgi:SAM-dependent methyltransferase